MRNHVPTARTARSRLWRTPLAAAASILLAAAGLEAQVTAVHFSPRDGKETGPVPVTISQVFKRGDIKGQILVTVDGKPVRAQTDVKRSYPAPGSSVKHALISLCLPALSAGGKATVSFADGGAALVKALPPVSAKDLLDTGFDAIVTFRFPGGGEASASARKMLQAAGDEPRTWLRGPVATEFLLAGPPADKDGKADPDMSVQFQVRRYAGWDGAWVSAVVENCWDHWAGNIAYDVRIESVYGNERTTVYEKKGVDHHSLARWRKCFWAGKAPADLHAVHDVPYLIAAGVLPRYDTGLKIAEEALAGMEKAWAAARTDILGPGMVREYMPSVGGRDDIGPYPAWTARYLLSMDERARKVAFGNADLAGSWPIHVRNSKTGRLVTLDERPDFWILPRGGDCPKFQPDRAKPAAPHKYEPDCAHHPSLAYVPYLLTGETYYLEEMYFWANFCLTYQWPTGRDKGKGLFKSDQIRGEAWDLRDIVDAAHMAPDGDPEGPYFDQRVKNNLAHWIGVIAGPKASPLGTYRPEAWETSRTNLGQYFAVAVWQQDFVIWAADHAADVGYADAAKFRDYLLKFPIGMLTSGPDFDPQYAATYFTIVGETPDRMYRTFKECWDTTASLGPHFETLLGKDKWKGLICWLPMKDSWYREYTWMTATIALRAKHPKAEQAMRFLQEQLPDLKRRFATDPTWALVPYAPGEEKP